MTSVNMFRQAVQVCMIALLLVTAVTTVSVTAQNLSVLDRRLKLEEERIVDILDETEWRMPPEIPGVTYDWGGWLSTNFYRFDDFDRSSAQPDSIEGAVIWDLRLWTKFFFGGNNSFYFRSKHQFTSTDWGGAYAGHDRTDIDGPHIDLAYVTFNFPRCTSARLGRQYFRLGRGLVLGNVLDGMKFNKQFRKSSVKTYLALTRPHENNLDTSIPGWDLGCRRMFAALAGEYRMSSGRRLYSYLLWEKDRSEELPEDANQLYAYDATYMGIGSEGVVIKDLTYWGDIVKQWGTIPVSGTTTTTKVKAAAFNLGVMWLPRMKLHPTLSFELYHGSGDDGRGHVTNAVGGKLTSGTDNGFYHFSTPGLGLAFTPRLSNLRVLKTAFSFKPFEREQSEQDLMVSIVGSSYRKRKAQGAISDLLATEAAKNVGSEIDLYLSWKLLSDIRMSMSFGRFAPGDAYPVANRNKTSFGNLSVSYSF